MMAMLWFKFILGLKYFELVSILFAIVPDYGNDYTTKENNNWTSFKNFAPKLNLNHNSNKWSDKDSHHFFVCRLWCRCIQAFFLGFLWDKVIDEDQKK